MLVYITIQYNNIFNNEINLSKHNFTYFIFLNKSRSIVITNLKCLYYYKLNIFIFYFRNNLKTK